jgi:lipopolysaccharide biosynthesis glycosyltransferase
MTNLFEVKMRLLVASRADNNIKNMTDITFPIIQKFCDKWNADFKILDHIPPVMSDDNRPHFRITKLYELLNDYDRVISLDSDVIINKNCPNLFEVIPEDSIGTIYEDKGTRRSNRIGKMKNAQLLFGDIGWDNGYINTGSFIVSKQHKEVFNDINGKYYTQDGSDDVHIGYKIHKMGLKVYELDYRFNHMTMFSEPWNNNANRFDSFIIHYAGVGVFDKTIASDRQEQITYDIKYIYGN